MEHAHKIEGTPLELKRDTYEEIFYPTVDGLYNYGVFLKPDGNGPFPAVIFVHGGGGGAWHPREKGIQNSLHNPVIRAVLDEGYAAFNVDYRNLDFGGLEVNDVIMAFKYLESRPDVIADKIGFIGGSHGGYIIMRAVMLVKAAAAVAYAGLIDFERMFFYQSFIDPSKRNWPLSNVYYEMKEKYGSNAEAYRALSIHTHAAEIKSPMLYVVGTEDPISLQLPTLKQAMEKAGKTLEISIHPGMPHTFYWGGKLLEKVLEKHPNAEEEFKRSLSKTIEFLKKYL